MYKHLQPNPGIAPFPAAKGKVVSAEEAVQLIHDGDTVAVSGIGGAVFAEAVAIALEKRFLDTAQPRNLTLTFASGIGNTRDKGVAHLAHEGLLGKVIAGHFGLTPGLGKLAVEGRIEAYNLPQGVLCQLYRDIAAKKPGLITRVGLGTFVDPRHGGGKINDRTAEDLVRLLPIDGEDYLFYKTFPIHVAILRGTTADIDGNVTMEHEALTLDVLPLAMAAKNSGGIVIVQVERLAERHSLDSRSVKIPGILVDCVVLARREQHWQTNLIDYNPAYSGAVRVPLDALPAIAMNERKIINRRAALELQPNATVNLGFGIPQVLATVAAEEKIADLLTLTTEPGSIGGVPADGLEFGAASNSQAIIDEAAQFDFYDGGGLDFAFLGLAQVDIEGNLNVSRFGPRLAGAGGFINISQNAKRVIFLGAFTAGDLQVTTENGRLVIVKEGETPKFVEAVDQRTFSGRHAAGRGLSVLYVTERSVFRLVESGLELIEIAPGIDLDRDILAHMAFRPAISPCLAEMDPRIFRPEPMGLRAELLGVPLANRFTYDAGRNILFVNFERLEIRHERDIEAMRQTVEELLPPIGRKVRAIINYDHFVLWPDLEDAYVAAAGQLTRRYCSSVSRYTTSAFLRMKLGEALQRRGAAPHLYESAEEAARHLRGQP